MIPAVVERSPLRGSPRCGFRTDSKKAFMINTAVSARLGAIFVWIQYSIRKKEQQAPLFGKMKHAERSVGSASRCSFYIEAAMRMCYNTVKGAGASSAHIGEVL